MTDTVTREAIQAALRADPLRARRLVRAYASRARRAGDALRLAEAALFSADLDLLAGRLSAAARRYREAAIAFRAQRSAAGETAARLGALQVASLSGEGAGIRRIARALRAAARGPLGAAQAESAIGSALDAIGDDRAAEGCFARALGLLRGRRGRKAEIARATARANLGIRMALRGATGPALRELEAALASFAKLDMPHWVALVRHNRGWVRGVAGEVQDALEDLAEARVGFERAGDRRGAALARLDEADLLLRLRAFDRAAAEARAASGALDRQGAPLEAARGRLVAARAHAGTGRAAVAQRLAQRAGEAFRRAGDRAGRAAAGVLRGEDLGRAEKVLLSAGNHLGAVEALLARARALPPAQGARLLRGRASRYPLVLRRWFEPDLHAMLALGAPAERIRHLRRACRAAETLRLLAPSATVRAATLAAHGSLYEDLAALLIERGSQRDLREAFLVLDALRARTLREEMERESPGSGEAPGVRRLRARLETLWRTLESRETGEGALRAVQVRLLREVASCERAYLRAVERLERPGAGRRGQEGLPSSDGLAFARVHDRIVGMRPGNGAIRCWDCGPLADLRSELDAFAFQVMRRIHGATDTGPAVASLERLGRRLLDGAGALEGRLWITLPAELGSLPVEALPVGGRPLVDTVSLTYRPHAGERGRRGRRRGRALLVGVGSERLPAVAGELRTIRRLLGEAHTLEGADATRGGILGLLKGSRLVHIAGHARSREDLPPLSALRVRDGWITAADLAGENLGGALVVLSACRTGDPSLRWRGEALGGFPRALLGGGAAGLVASRWEIGDEVARAWMGHFYRGLQAHGADVALARAARAVRSRYGHPADWAAFLFVGGGSMDVWRSS